MNILAIETSCDETALSIIQTESLHVAEPNFRVLSDIVISQIDVHAEYGGVFPALAKREHAKNLTPLLQQSLKNAGLYLESRGDNTLDQSIKEMLEREPEMFNDLQRLLSTIKKPEIDVIMVTHGPGLAPALWVGVNFARALSVIWDIPIIPVNHMEGHITSILLKENYQNRDQALLPLGNFQFPLLALLISGGHTQLVLVKNWCAYEIIGETIDDAVGEAFDKVARMLGMKYPGGPKISIAAQNGSPNDLLSFPRPMLHSKDYRFSFSGLKTSVRYKIDELKKENKLDDQMIADIAREFEHAVAEVLIKKTCQAIEEFGVQGLIIAGGVSANTFITEQFRKKISDYGIPLYLPEKNLCGDNALMIATAGFINYWKNKGRGKNSQGYNKNTSQEEVIALSNLKLS
jgi:N6-L-threonylcarbamoyladenine synthase